MYNRKVLIMDEKEDNGIIKEVVGFHLICEPCNKKAYIIINKDGSLAFRCPWCGRDVKAEEIPF